MKCIKKLSQHCVSAGIISEEKIIWFQYSIERRLTTILVGCPFFILALVISNFWTSIAFFYSFYILRCRINGFHSNTLFGCLIISLLCETFFLTFFYNLLSPYLVLSINVINTVIVYWLAPYKSTAFPLTSNELKAITKSSRIRVITLSIVACILSFFGIDELAEGITTGTAMAVFLLGLAYILNGGKTNDQAAA